MRGNGVINRPIQPAVQFGRELITNDLRGLGAILVGDSFLQFIAIYEIGTNFAGFVVDNHNPDLIQIFPGLCQKGSRSIGAEHLLLPYHAMGVPIDEGIQTADIFNHFFTCPGRGGWIVTQVAYSDDFGSTGFADGIYRILNLVI